MKLKKVFHIVCGGVLLAALCGCGDVEWFPEGDGSGSTAGDPDAILITSPATITQAEAAGGVLSVSNDATVTGTSATGWPVVISAETAGADSKFRIGTGEFGTTGTVLPNQTITIQHKPSTSVNGQVSTTLKVGTGRFVTFVTNTVANP